MFLEAFVTMLVVTILGDADNGGDKRPAVVTDD